MDSISKRLLGGRIIEPEPTQTYDTSAIAARASMAANPQDEAAAYMATHHPDPFLRLTSDGQLAYTNERAKAIFGPMSLEEKGLELYRLGVFVQKVLSYGEPLKIQYHIDNSDYRVIVRPVTGLPAADFHFTEISESVKIKNYFEVQAAFAEALLKADTVHDVVWTIVKEAVVRLGYEDCVVYLLDEDGVTLTQKAAHGPKNPRDTHVSNPITLKVGQGIAGSVAASMQGEVVNDTSKDPRYIVDDQSRLSEIAVPIMDGEKLIGVIDSEHRHRNFYTNEDLSILNAIASMVSTKIQRISSLESIKAAESKTRSLIDHAFGGIYTLRGKRFEMVNRVFKEITGYTERELTAEDFDMKNLIFQVEDQGQAAIEARAKGDTERKSYQLDVKTKSGNIKRLAINTVILQDEKGPYTLGIALDITRALNSERLLKEVNEELCARNAELRQFAHLASHNLRAPVSNLMGLLNILDPEELGAQNQEVLIGFRQATDLLNATLDEMHDVLNAKAGEEHNLIDISLVEMLETVKNDLAPNLTQCGIEISANFEIQAIKYLHYHVYNIFETLIANAIQYRNPKITPILKITTRRTSKGIVFSFQDNGMGIDLDNFGSELFKPNTRLHKEESGKGMGLHNLRKQLMGMGGDITAESQPGKGSTFHVLLKTL